MEKVISSGFTYIKFGDSRCQEGSLDCLNLLYNILKDKRNLRTKIGQAIYEYYRSSGNYVSIDYYELRGILETLEAFNIIEEAKAYIHSIEIVKENHRYGQKELGDVIEYKLCVNLNRGWFG